MSASMLYALAISGCCAIACICSFALGRISRNAEVERITAQANRASQLAIDTAAAVESRRPKRDKRGRFAKGAK